MSSASLHKKGIRNKKGVRGLWYSNLGLHQLGLLRTLFIPLCIPYHAWDAPRRNNFVVSQRYILFRFINMPCPPPQYVLRCITEQIKSLNFVGTNRNTGAYLRNSVEYWTEERGKWEPILEFSSAHKLPIYHKIKDRSWLKTQVKESKRNLYKQDLLVHVNVDIFTQGLFLGCIY